MSHKSELSRLDRAHVWHPFTQMKSWLENEPLIIESGDGCELIDSEGNRYIDGVSSLWVNVHGHRNPAIDAAIQEQLGRLSHSTLLGLANPPSILLAKRLVDLAPPGLTKVFYSEAGASAVEVALKMAFGYWQQTNATNKTGFLSLQNGYHGDTLGAASVGGIDLFHAAYAPLLFESMRAPSPNCYRPPPQISSPTAEAFLQLMETILAANHREICAVILEPLVQAAAGMIVAPPGYLAGVRKLCDRYKVLLIADEVATGVGRTGTFFACEQEGVSPDILVAGKGLSGGYLPLSVTMTTQRIFDAFLGEPEEQKTFFHGHSYSGNPLASAAALANLDEMEQSATLANVQQLGPLMDKWLKPLWDHPHVGDIRRCGFMCGIELVADKQSKSPFEAQLQMGAAVAAEARKLGAIIRPLGDVVVLMPPLSIKEELLQRLIEATTSAIESVVTVSGGNHH